MPLPEHLFSYSMTCLIITTSVNFFLFCFSQTKSSRTNNLYLSWEVKLPFEPVCPLVCLLYFQSAIISSRGEKFFFHGPIGALLSLFSREKINCIGNITEISFCQKSFVIVTIVFKISSTIRVWKLHFLPL